MGGGIFAVDGGTFFCRRILLAPPRMGPLLRLALFGQDHIPLPIKKPRTWRGEWGNVGNLLVSRVEPFRHGVHVVVVDVFPEVSIGRGGHVPVVDHSGSERVHRLELDREILVPFLSCVLDRIMHDELIVCVDVVHEFRIVGGVLHVPSIAQMERMSTHTGKKSYPQSIHLGESMGCNLLAVCYNTRMTRKDFQLIADTIDGLIDDGSLSPHEAVTIASRFQTALASTNPRFDHQRFYAAATKSLPRVEKNFSDSCG